MRLAQFLLERHVPFETVMHPPAFTALKRARFLRISGRHVVKCVLLASGASFILAIVRAMDHVDLDVLGACLELPVRLANEDELADRFRDCERGALTPFGSLYGLTTFLEDAIGPEDVIVFEAQQHAMAIRMKCHDFEILEKPTRCRFARHVTTSSAP
jgi:Ala-tRNA(Pro) deacylase